LPLNYKITFPADYKNIAPIREMVFHTAELQGFEKNQAEHARSIVDELCSNAIEHGSQPTSEVLLEVHSDENTIRITCQDQGHGNKLKAADIKEVMSKEVPIEKKRGRGITMIVKAFAEALEIEDREGGGISITAVIHKSG